VTTISGTDAIRLGIGLSSLKRGIPARGVGGVVSTWRMGKVFLGFERTDGRIKVESLDNVDVLEKTDDRLHSLLGLDILSKYKISFTNRYCYLDR